jgi:hypothetical protein
LIALSGSFEVVLTTDTTKFIYFKQTQQLHIPPGIWRVRKFSSGAICLVLASDVFMEDYIRILMNLWIQKMRLLYLVPNIK